VQIFSGSITENFNELVVKDCRICHINLSLFYFHLEYLSHGLPNFLFTVYKLLNIN
jgi:hypothetical protein